MENLIEIPLYYSKCIEIVYLKLLLLKFACYDDGNSLIHSINSPPPSAASVNWVSIGSGNDLSPVQHQTTT